MKPLGLTPDYVVTMPTPVEDAVWDAVEEAQRSGWTVERFRRECAESWSCVLRERAKRDAVLWSKP